jgi:hypothetical protein
MNMETCEALCSGKIIVFIFLIGVVAPFSLCFYINCAPSLFIREVSSSEIFDGPAIFEFLEEFDVLLDLETICMSPTSTL